MSALSILALAFLTAPVLECGVAETNLQILIQRNMQVRLNGNTSGPVPPPPPDAHFNVNTAEVLHGYDPDQTPAGAGAQANAKLMWTYWELNSELPNPNVPSVPWFSARLQGDFRNTPPIDQRPPIDLTVVAFLDQNPTAGDLNITFHDGRDPYPVAIPPPAVISPVKNGDRFAVGDGLILWAEIGRVDLLAGDTVMIIPLDPAALKAHAQQPTWNGKFLIAVASDGEHSAPHMGFIERTTPALPGAVELVITHGVIAVESEPATLTGFDLGPGPL